MKTTTYANMGTTKNVLAGRIISGVWATMGGLSVWGVLTFVSMIVESVQSVTG